MVERSPSNSGKTNKKDELLYTKVDKVALLEKIQPNNFQEDSRALGVLIREIFASPRVGTVQKGATNYQIYTKRVKFEGGIKRFFAEWENLIKGFFEAFSEGESGQNLPKVLHSKCII